MVSGQYNFRIRCGKLSLVLANIKLRLHMQNWFKMNRFEASTVKAVQLCLNATRKRLNHVVATMCTELYT